jgi:alpha-L-fucosidase
MKNRVLLPAALLALIPFFSGCEMKGADKATAKAATTAPEIDKDQRMAWWRAARFGMFIHWGVYSVPAGRRDGKEVPGLGEWIMNKGEIPVADYAQYPAQFDPVDFNADQWVSIAKNAGMKYIVITAKHHDGFAMFKSSVDGYNIVDATPFHRDPLKELAAACKKQGIKLGFYYSQDQDWHHPGAAAIGGHWDPAAQDGDFANYVRTIAEPQVKELLTNYGTVSVLWWDTPTKEMTPELAGELHDLLKLQPNIISNNRLGGGFKGDTETPEQRIPPTGFAGRDWETCMTINNTWGYRVDDTEFKSPELLLRNLIDIASKGGNYLLNVGPTSLGVIPRPEVERLATMGDWLKINGEAIYGTGPTMFGPEAGALSETEKDTKGAPKFVAKWEWRCTTKPGKVFIHLMKWPDKTFTLDGMKGRVTKAYLLADPHRAGVTFTQEGEKVTITLPGDAPDVVASVLCLETTN